jgi:arginine/lysine/ornithine decarboxylase
VTQSIDDLDAGVRLLRGAFLLDHSVSVTELGSIFQRDGDAPVQQLKRNVAEAYGVAWSFPASCGTSPLNVLALLSIAPPGATVLVNRDCHVSVHAAMIHGGLRPVYYRPRFDAALGIPVGAAAADVVPLLERHPDAACVVVTYPNYFGVAGECGAIVDAAHARGIPVLADAAHGAPLHFCSGLPAAAEDLGADLVLQSTHKTMGALSQGSVALFRDETYVERFYDLASHLGFVSTSFSYPTLSSIELAVARHALDGDAAWRRAADEADRFRGLVRAIDGVTTFGADAAGGDGFRDLDRTRVTLDVSGTGLTGYDFARRLEAAQVYPEMATLRHVLLLFTPGTRREDATYLAAAIEQAAEQGSGRALLNAWPAPPPIPAMGLAPRDAYFATKRTVDVADAVGALSAETIAPYPPGSAVIVAGEVLDADTLAYLRSVRDAGGVLYGASDPELRRVRIIVA